MPDFLARIQEKSVQNCTFEDSRAVMHFRGPERARSGSVQGISGPIQTRCNGDASWDLSSLSYDDTCMCTSVSTNVGDLPQVRHPSLLLPIWHMLSILYRICRILGDLEMDVHDIIPYSRVCNILAWSINCDTPLTRETFSFLTWFSDINKTMLHFGADLVPTPCMMVAIQVLGP